MQSIRVISIFNAQHFREKLRLSACWQAGHRHQQGLRFWSDQGGNGVRWPSSNTMIMFASSRGGGLGYKLGDSTLLCTACPVACTVAWTLVKGTCREERPLDSCAEARVLRSKWGPVLLALGPCMVCSAARAFQGLFQRHMLVAGNHTIGSARSQT
eukprot:1158134-Pelagomonas_calceolata.AAC.2